MYIHEAVEKSMEEGKSIFRQGYEAMLILPTDTTDCCIGFIMEPDGSYEKAAVRWNPTAEDLMADDWKLVE